MTDQSAPSEIVRIHHNGWHPFHRKPWTAACTCGYQDTFPTWKAAITEGTVHAHKHGTTEDRCSGVKRQHPATVPAFK